MPFTTRGHTRAGVWPLERSRLGYRRACVRSECDRPIADILYTAVYEYLGRYMFIGGRYARTYIYLSPPRARVAALSSTAGAIRSVSIRSSLR